MVITLWVIGAGRLAAAEAGDDWIANECVRVRLELRPLARQWQWVVDRREADDWQQVGQGAVIGRGSGKLDPGYRARWKVFYPLQEALIERLRASADADGARLDFRVIREDLWLDLRISLVGDSPFVRFECTDRSHEALMPHSRWYLPTMMQLTSDGGNGRKIQTLRARDHREGHAYADFARWLVAWAPEQPRLYALLLDPDDPQRRSQWPPAGFGSVYLDLPYSLWCEAIPAPRDHDLVGQFGQSLWLQARWQRRRASTQPEEEKP